MKNKKIINVLEKSYKDIGICTSYNAEHDLLEVSLNEKTIAIVIKVIDEDCTFTNISEQINKLEQLNVSTNYRLIYTKGICSGVEDFLSFNVHVTDLSFVEEFVSNPLTYIEMLPHNIAAYQKIDEMLETTDKVCITHATGTGKSTVIAKLAASKKYDSILYVAPTKVLKEQTQKALEGLDVKIDYITYTENSLKGGCLDNSYSCIFLDEYHRAGAPQWQKSVENLFNENPKAKKIGFSATPIRYLDGSRNMAIELFDGNVASELDLVQSLIRKILPTPKYITCLIDTDNLKDEMLNCITKSNRSDLIKEQSIKEVINWHAKYNEDELIDRILKENINPIGKYIVFCTDGNHLIKCKSTMDTWFKRCGFEYNSFEVKGEYKEEDNNKTISDFKCSSGKISLLFSINMLNEGVNFSQLSGVFMLRRTESPIIAFQQMGRAIRSDNANKPVIFDFVSNCNNIVARNIIGSVEKSVERYNENRGFFNLSYIDYVPDIFNTTEEICKLLIDINSRLQDTWDDMFIQLNQFFIKNGHSNVPKNGQYKELATWVSNQRRIFKINKLSKYQIDKLKSVNFVFDMYEYMWHIRYNEILEYIEKSLTKTETQRQWLSMQRDAFTNGKLSEEQISLLKAINFNFKKRAPKKQLDFDETINIAKEFVSKNGLSELKYSTIYNGVKIGTWFKNLEFRYKKDKLAPDKVQALIDAGLFKKEDNKELRGNESSWASCFTRFKELENMDKSQISSEDKKWMSRWKSKQKSGYLKGTLSQDKVEELNKYSDIRALFKI